MRVSTAGRYSLRVMLDVALHHEQGATSRQDISTRQAISAEYIAQLTRRLSKAGLIETSMGPGGGYWLARGAESIRLGEIFRAAEGPVAAVACVLLDKKTTCMRADSCAARIIWSRLSEKIEDYLDSVSLEELCSISRQLEKQEEGSCTAVDVLLNPVSRLTSTQENCIYLKQENEDLS
jgi:Rrf2 family transcriptional regulator, cysteine metabolism repressor